MAVENEKYLSTTREVWYSFYRASPLAVTHFMTYRSCSAPQPMIFYTLQLQHQQIFYKIILVPCLIIIGNAGTGSSNRIARRVAYKREQHATTTLLIFLTTTRTDATSNFIIHDSSHGWLVPKMRDWLHLLLSVPYTSISCKHDNAN